MTYYFIAFLVFIGLSMFMFSMGEKGYDGKHLIAGFFGVVGCIVSLIGLVFSGFLGLQWAASGSKAGIINREYGTNYTQAEIFYASDVIDTVRELQRRRVEVNGDVFRNQADPNVQARREKAK